MINSNTMCWMKRSLDLKLNMNKYQLWILMGAGLRIFNGQLNAASLCLIKKILYVVRFFRFWIVWKYTETEQSGNYPTNCTVTKASSAV